MGQCQSTKNSGHNGKSKQQLNGQEERVKTEENEGTVSGQARKEQSQKAKQDLKIGLQHVQAKYMADMHNNLLNLKNLYSQETLTDSHTVYDVKGNLDNFSDASAADVVFLLDVNVYKKYNTVTKNSIYAIINDFKRYFLLEIPTPQEEFTRLFLILYSSTFVDDVVSFKIDQQNELIETCNNADESKKTELKGEINALNQVLKVDFLEDNAKFVFHFAHSDAKFSEDDEISSDFTSLDFKYELIYFNKIEDDTFQKKVENVLKYDVSVIPLPTS